MSAFAIRPPVQLRDGHAVGSSSEAAEIVRRHAVDHCSLAASILLRSLEDVASSEEAQRLALEFRAWAAREGLLLTRPIKLSTGARPSQPR